MKKKKYKLKKKFYIPFIIIILIPFYIIGYKIFIHKSNNNKVDKIINVIEKMCI